MGGREGKGSCCHPWPSQFSSSDSGAASTRLDLQTRGPSHLGSDPNRSPLLKAADIRMPSSWSWHDQPPPNPFPNAPYCRWRQIQWMWECAICQKGIDENHVISNGHRRRVVTYFPGGDPAIQPEAGAASAAAAPPPLPPPGPAAAPTRPPPPSAETPAPAHQPLALTWSAAPTPATRPPGLPPNPPAPPAATQEAPPPPGPPPPFQLRVDGPCTIIINHEDAVRMFRQLQAVLTPPPPGPPALPAQAQAPTPAGSESAAPAPTTTTPTAAPAATSAESAPTTAEAPAEWSTSWATAAAAAAPAVLDNAASSSSSSATSGGAGGDYAVLSAGQIY